MTGVFNCAGAAAESLFIETLYQENGESRTRGRFTFEGYHLEVYPYRQKQKRILYKNTIDFLRRCNSLLLYTMVFQS